MANNQFIGETSGKYWKQKNDETYVNEEELVKITDLDESESVDDDDLLIKGNASTGTMLRIKVANFLDGIKEKLLGSTDISSVGDGTVTGAISTNAQNITANKSDADSKYTELSSALAEKSTIKSYAFTQTTDEYGVITFSSSYAPIIGCVMGTTSRTAFVETQNRVRVYSTSTQPPERIVSTSVSGTIYYLA